jgi:opacity protein-like surface antigen
MYLNFPIQLRFVIGVGLLLSCSLFSNEPGAPVSELQRRFLELEQRALRLSDEIAVATGTEPIKLIDRNESLAPVIESQAQASYDSLPGPVVEPLNLPEEDSQDTKPIVLSSQVNRVVATTQQRKGDYYLMPSIGFAVATNTTFSEAQLDDELEGEWGNSIGILAGRRWDNWMAYARVAYQYLEYENPKFQGLTQPTRVEGTEESFSLMVGGGYTIPLFGGLSTYGGLGGGLAWRRNSADVEIYVSNLYGSGWQSDTRSQSDSELVFTYDFSLGLEYLLKNNFSILLGYRLLGLSRNHSFEGSFQHLIELGVGANF